MKIMWILAATLAVGLIVGLTIFIPLQNKRVSEQDPVVEGGGSVTRVAKAGQCDVYRVFLPDEERPVYVVSGAGTVSCGVVR